MRVKLARMVTDPGEWGPRLYAYLETHWQASGTNANAWADRNPGIQGPTLSRWRSGTAPSLPAMIAVADALGVTLVDVLLACGVLAPADVDGRTATQPAAPNIDVAIEHDPSLVRWQRDRLTEILAAMRQVEAGADVAANAPRRRK